MSGFKATGVTPTAILAKKKGISFMPFYSPTHDVGQPFTSEERECFQRRYEEGYDLHDDRCDLWLKVHHPEVEGGLRVQLFTNSPATFPSTSDHPLLSPSNPPPISPEVSLQSPHPLSPSPPPPVSTHTRSPSPPCQVSSKLSEFLPVPAPFARKTTNKKSSGVCYLGVMCCEVDYIQLNWQNWETPFTLYILGYAIAKVPIINGFLLYLCIYIFVGKGVDQQ